MGTSGQVAGPRFILTAMLVRVSAQIRTGCGASMLIYALYGRAIARPLLVALLDQLHLHWPAAVFSLSSSHTL